MLTQVAQDSHKKSPPPAPLTPALTRPAAVEFKLTGEIGRRLKAVTEQWLIPTPAANPLLLSMFRERDRRPYRDLVPWAGEFAGKYLTHAVQVLRLTGDDDLKIHLERFVAELCACQDTDGYLGCWPQPSRLTNQAPNCTRPTWDTWSAYHVMLGLLLWHEYRPDAQALRSAERMADLLCEKYLGPKTPRLVDTGSTEMNLAPIHSLCLLYRQTGTPAYLALARQLLAEFAARDDADRPLAGDYLQAPLAGREFHETPKPRWESLHPILGLAELYYLTGEAGCRQAFESLWWSMLKGDRHNNGGFTSGEQATGDPYHIGAIETCCTVAWMAMSVEMLKLTGDSRVADELELSLFNSGLGLMSPTGRWVTYNTPMDGRRIASPNDATSFQARPGGNELNCCSVNGPRVLGLLAEWACLQSPEGLALNYYGPGQIQVRRPSGNRVTLRQETAYPAEAEIEVRLNLDAAESFTLALRIPSWSRHSRVWVNGAELTGLRPGGYLSLAREWRDGDLIRLELDFRLQFWRHPTRLPAGMAASAWETEWRLAGPIVNRGDSPAGLAPADLRLDQAASLAEVAKLDRGPAKTVFSSAGRIDFSAHLPAAGPFAAAWCFTEIEVPADGVIPILIGCDWWYSALVNGQNIVPGNSGSKERQMPALLPVKAGRNLVGFRVTAGSQGWMLDLGRGDFIPTGPAASGTPGGKPFASIYRGPLLLAYDARFNSGGYSGADVPLLARPELARVPGGEQYPSPAPLLLMEGKDPAGRPIRYCDFASAGATGNYYQSWLPLGFECPRVEFSRENPRRSQPLG